MQNVYNLTVQDCYGETVTRSFILESNGLVSENVPMTSLTLPYTPSDSNFAQQTKFIFNKDLTFSTEIIFRPDLKPNSDSAPRREYLSNTPSVISTYSSTHSISIRRKSRLISINGLFEAFWTFIKILICIIVFGVGIVGILVLFFDI